MEMYNVSDHGNAETYLIQGTESSPYLTTSLLEQIDAMYNEGAPEYVIDQGLYYPTATNYGYYCTGFESPGDWNDHHRIFALDGPDVQYTGSQTESLPYVYYTPSYGYAQSPYNPYNPYIPGATIGVDGQFVGTQQFYTPYQSSVSSPAYYPFVVQNSSQDLLLDTGSSTANRPNGRGQKNNLNSSSAAFTMTPARPASNQTHSFARISEGLRTNAGPSNLPVAHGSLTSGGFPSSASSHVFQGRSASASNQTIDSVSNGRVSSHRTQLKVSLPVSNAFSDFGANVYGHAAVDKLRPKFQYSRSSNVVNGSPDLLSEQNRGPRTNKSKNHISVKAYATKAGDGNAQDSIIIYTDQYNKDDFPVDYLNAKFFVIKSYSEDDVHKSIKYNVWSSTPNGNRKLDNAYADAQKIASGDPSGCPIFLFFSVNASGQFCGVAEMTSPVDFHKDMDFWQQDKWTGSFSVKWHMIKDVPNTSFRHIILENNENKPVTNSRDTQEIRYRQGLEMLRIFKCYTLRTSLLDDIMYYENRQKIMQEEKARLLLKSYENPFLVSASNPPRKLNCIVDPPPSKVEEMSKPAADSNSSEKSGSTSEHVPLNPDAEKTKHAKDEGKGVTSTLMIGSLTINPKPDEAKPSVPASTVVDVVTVGSMPVKVNGFTESSRPLTVGSIPLDPKALQLGKTGVSGKGGSQN